MKAPTSTFSKLFALTAVALGAMLSVGQDELAIDTRPDSSRPRPFVQISEQPTTPTVSAIAPIDDTNVFFLNQRGQIGVAKFSPGLSLIGWDYYSKVKLNALPSLALGPNYSVVTASTKELTQSFDTDQDGSLDFFQALVRKWEGQLEGVRITAGPVADPHGRLLFALSPFAPEDGAPPVARLVAWNPADQTLKTVTWSQLVIGSFALGPDSLLAARLLMPDYEDGYYVSLTELPPVTPADSKEDPTTLPKTLPSLLIPAELTDGKPPTQLCFFFEDGKEKLLLTCPESKQLIEIVPEKSGKAWQGSILLRSKTTYPVQSLIEFSPGKLLGGGENGFVPLEINPDLYRITRISIAEDVIVLDFSEEVDRLQAVKPDSYSVQSVSLRGGKSEVSLQPTVESDGKTVILKSSEIQDGTVLRVVCQNLPSSSGKALFNTSVFYTIRQR